MTEYAERDLKTPELHNLFAQHLNAITIENLHSKSDIAAELAWRDARIAALERNNLALTSQVIDLQDCVSESFEFTEDPEFVTAQESLANYTAEKKAEVLRELIVEHELKGILSWMTRLHQKEAELLRQAEGDHHK